MRTDPVLNDAIALERRRDELSIVLGAARGEQVAQAALRELLSEAVASLSADVDESLMLDAAAAVFVRLTRPRPHRAAGITAFRGERSLAGWVRTQLAREAALMAAGVH